MFRRDHLTSDMERVQLGWGHQTLTGMNVEADFKGDTKPDSRSHIKFEIIQLQDQRSAQEHFSGEIKAGAGAGVVKGQASLAAKREVSSSAEIYKYKFVCSIVLAGKSLTPGSASVGEIKKLLEPSKTAGSTVTSTLEDFYKRRGDSFVNYIAEGGMIDVNFYSTKRKEDLSKSFSEAVGCDVAGLATLNQNLEWLKKQSVLTASSSEKGNVWPVCDIGSVTFENLHEKVTLLLNALTGDKKVSPCPIYYMVRPYDELEIKNASELTAQYKKVTEIIKQLSDKKDQIIAIEKNAAKREFYFKGNPPDITHDFFKTNRTQFPLFKKQIDEIINAYLENIFSLKTASCPSIPNAVSEILKWFNTNESVCDFAATHTLIHIVNPKEKSKTSDQCYRFKAGTLRLINTPEYKDKDAVLLIDAININCQTADAVPLTITHKTGFFSKDKKLYECQLTTDTADLLRQKSADLTNLVYIPSSALLDPTDTRGKRIELTTDLDNCLIRIYITKIKPADIQLQKVTAGELQHAASSSAEVKTDSDEYDIEDFCDLTQFSQDGEQKEEASKGATYAGAVFKRPVTPSPSSPAEEAVAADLATETASDLEQAVHTPTASVRKA